MSFNSLQLSQAFVLCVHTVNQQLPIVYDEYVVRSEFEIVVIFVGTDGITPSCQFHTPFQNLEADKTSLKYGPSNLDMNFGKSLGPSRGPLLIIQSKKV